MILSVVNSQLLPENDNSDSLVLARKPSLPFSTMKDLLALLAHLLTTLAKLLGPGGAKAIVDLMSGS